MQQTLKPSARERLLELAQAAIIADMVSTLVEGGIVLNKVLREPKLLATQIMLYRTFIQQVFARD